MTSTHRSKRRQGFAVGQSKMTAEEYEQLIGQYEHIEHKALHSEIAKEFEQIQQTNQSRTIVTNALLHPPQPPPLPVEANKSKGIQFRPATPWPSYSVIQRAAHMLFQHTFSPEEIRKYLQSINIPPIQIEIAFEVYELLLQSENYWRKVRYLKLQNYQARHDSQTRKECLQNASWALQIAMTLSHFHLDHIVDIRCKNETWSADCDEYYEQKRKSEELNLKKPSMSDTERVYEESSLSYDEESTSYNSYEVTEEESGEVPIGQMIDEMNEVADHMSKADLDRMRQTVRDQLPLDQLFAGMFKGVENVALADNFETDLFDNDEKAEVLETKEDPGLERLYEKYKHLERNVVRDTWIQQGKDVNAAIFMLDERE